MPVAETANLHVLLGSEPVQIGHHYAIRQHHLEAALSEIGEIATELFDCVREDTFGTDRFELDEIQIRPAFFFEIAVAAIRPSFRIRTSSQHSSTSRSR